MSKYRYRLGRHSYETSQTVTAAVLLLPTLIALGFLFIYPVIRVFYLSFTNTNTITNISTWVGLKNFEFLLRNKMFGKAFGNTVWFTIGKLSGEVILSLLLAVMLEYHIVKDIAHNSRLHSLFTTKQGEQAYETDHLRIQHG